MILNGMEMKALKAHKSAVALGFNLKAYMLVRGRSRDN